MSNVVELKKYRRQAKRLKRATWISELCRVSIAGSWAEEVVRTFWRQVLFTSVAFAIAVHLNSMHEPHGTSIAAALVLVGVAWCCYTIGLPIVGSMEEEEYEEHGAAERRVTIESLSAGAISGVRFFHA